MRRSRILSGLTSRRSRSGYLTPVSGDAPFSPASVAGLYLWLKADAITGLNDGDAVATWVDSSSSGADATQGTAGNRPTYQTAEVNSLPCVRFDGTDDYLTSVASAGSKPITIFVVLKVTNFLDFRVIWGSQGGAGDRGYEYRINQTSGVQNVDHALTANIGSSSTAVPLNTWCYLAFSYSNTGGFTFYENGVSDGTGTADFTIQEPGVVIGGRNGGSLSFLGDIAEIFAYDSVITGDDLTNINTYITDKYAL